MNTTLEFVDPAPREHLSILLFGPSGVGKSTAACSAPGPIVYCNADGPGAIRFARRLHSGTEILELPIGRARTDDGIVIAKRPLEQLYVELRSGDLEGPKTVVFDSLGRIYDLILDEVARGGKPSLPQRGEVNTWLERYVLALLELPVHVVLVAHDNPVVVSGKEEDGTAEIQLFPHTGTNNPALAKKLMRPLDIVAYCGRTVSEDENGEHRQEFLAQTIGARGRHAKDRTDVIGDFAPLDLTDWIERVQAAYSPAEAKTEKTKTNTKETVSA